MENPLDAWDKLPGTKAKGSIPSTTDDQDTSNEAPTEGTPSENPDSLTDDEPKADKKVEGDSSNSSSQTHDFEKRFKDSQRYIQQLKDEHKKEVNDLRDKLLAGDRASLPKTPEELAAFKQNYGELYDLVFTMIKQEAASQSDELNSELESIREKQKQIAIENSFTELLKVHPDAREIKADPKFHEWFRRQTKHIQDMINSEDTTIDDISFALDKYKRDEGIQTVVDKKTEKKEEQVKAATAVDVDSKAPATAKDKRIWSESEIQNMSSKEFAQHEKEITKAQREGRLIFDISRPETVAAR